jgi:hypothetical protein
MDLHVSQAVDAHHLTLDLSFRNRLDVDIYVEQFLPSRTWPPERGGYVYAHRDGMLLVYFGTVPNPPRFCLAQEIKLYAELLRPSQTRSASISLPIPVVERGKFSGRDSTAHEVVEVSLLRLVVCYKRKQRSLKLREAFPQSGLFELWYGESEKVEANFALPRPIAALRRTDDFDRPFEADQPATG